MLRAQRIQLVGAAANQERLDALNARIQARERALYKIAGLSGAAAAVIGGSVGYAASLR